MKLLHNFKKHFEGMSGDAFDPEWNDFENDDIENDIAHNKLKKNPSKITIANINNPNAQLQRISSSDEIQLQTRQDSNRRFKLQHDIINKITNINVLNGKYLDIELKKVRPNPNASFAQEGDKAYTLYTFVRGARKELLYYGFIPKIYRRRQNNVLVDTTEDPMFIFLNTTKGGYKYTYINEGDETRKKLLLFKLRQDELVTNNFISSLLNNSTLLVYNWWLKVNGPKRPPIGIYYPESSNMNYPSDFVGKSFNEHWALMLSDVFKTNDVTPYAQKPNEILKKRGNAINTVNVNTNFYKPSDYAWKDNVPDNEKTLDNISDDTVETNDDGSYKLVRGIRDVVHKIRDLEYEENETIPIKNIPAINRWRLSDIFVYNFINQNVISKLLQDPNEKILLIDDNIVSGTTLFDTLNGLCEIEFNNLVPAGNRTKINRNQVIVISTFDAKSQFSSEKEEIIEEIKRIKEKVLELTTTPPYPEEQIKRFKKFGTDPYKHLPDTKKAIQKIKQEEIDKHRWKLKNIQQSEDYLKQRDEIIARDTERREQEVIAKRDAERAKRRNAIKDVENKFFKMYHNKNIPLRDKRDRMKRYLDKYNDLIQDSPNILRVLRDHNMI